MARCSICGDRVPYNVRRVASWAVLQRVIARFIEG